MNISNNTSSIQSYQSMMNRSANNIATDTNADLAKEIPTQMVAQSATKANVSAIKTQDEMLGSLLDIKAQSIHTF